MVNMVNGKTLYSKLSPEDVADYVIIAGDPWRVDMQAKHLENAKHISFSREFNTYTGYYKGLRVTISSTGMGTPSAIEMLEELVDCNAKVVLRMGTAGPYDDNNFGKFLIANSGMAEDETSLKYAPANYPVVVDHRLVECLEDAVKARGFESATGIVRSSGGGDASLSLTRFGEHRRSVLPYYETVDEMQRWGIAYGLTMLDFESAGLIKVGNLMNIVIGSLCLATVKMDRTKKMMHTDPARLKEMEDALCLVALDGIFLLNQRYGKDILKDK